jgi:hypothetical protein
MVCTFQRNSSEVGNLLGSKGGSGVGWGGGIIPEKQNKTQIKYTKIHKNTVDGAVQT